MNEQDLADRFSRDVDSLLSEAGRMDSEPTPTEYRQALDLARTLATSDFSAESRVRQALRRQLLNQIGTREGWQQRKEYPMRTFFWKRHPAVTLAVVVLVALLAVTLAWPEALTAVAQGTYNIVQRIGLGPYTQAKQVEFQAKVEPQPLSADDVWLVITDIGAFAGNAPPGTEPTVRSLTDFEEAQTATDFHLWRPTDLPEGYVLREVKLAPVGGGFSTFLFYGDPDHDIILVQMPAGPQPSDDPRVVVSAVSRFVTNGTLEEVELNGRPAAWASNHSLMWEAGGISYVLGGLDLSLDQAIRIAESLE